MPMLLGLMVIAVVSPRGDYWDRDNAADTTEQRSDERSDIGAEEAKAQAPRRGNQAALHGQLREEQRLAEEEHARQEREQQQAEAAQPCHPAYDPCLDPNASDYDCESGREDGPRYTGLVTVKNPSDPYDLDRDGDRIGCD
jgi:hypothetical protein